MKLIETNWMLHLLGLQFFTVTHATQKQNKNMTDTLSRRQGPPLPPGRDPGDPQGLMPPPEGPMDPQGAQPGKSDVGHVNEAVLAAATSTGVLCGRTIYYKYYTFKNYCLLDYVNCMERYELWQVAHMGECYVVKELTEYILYPYDDDLFLDQYYLVEDN